MGETGSSGHLEIVRLLLGRSADPNLSMRWDGGYGCRADDLETGVTALMLAANRGRLEHVRLLLECSADPNMATDYGNTALMNAADGIGDPSGAHIDCAQLLLVYGADPTVEDFEGQTAASIPGYEWDNSEEATIFAEFLGATEAWPTFKVAVACRLHADALRLLRRGCTDPSDCSSDELSDVSAAQVNALWPGSPGPCDATAALVRAAMSSWSPSRHPLHHSGVRSSVLTTLLVARRLQDRATAANALTKHQLRMLPRSSKPSMPMIGLPNELWLVVCSFFRRSDWVSKERERQSERDRAREGEREREREGYRERGQRERERERLERGRERREEGIA